jgi:hypothetical protein
LFNDLAISVIELKGWVKVRVRADLNQLPTGFVKLPHLRSSPGFARGQIKYLRAHLLFS